MNNKSVKDLKILFSEGKIRRKTAELAKKINAAYNKDDELCVVCVLKGSSMFCCDLIKHLKMDVQLEFIRISSYGNEEKSSGHLDAMDLTLPNLADKNVLIVEDIVDSGLTATFLFDLILFKHKPKKLEFVSLLNKKCAREIDVTIDYWGFEIDDKFVVGYGLDYKGYFRNLPYIGYFPN